MEVNAVNQMRRTAVRIDEKKQDVQAASASAGTQLRADRLTLTGQAAAQLTEQSQRLMNLLERSGPEKKRPAAWDMLDGSSGEDGDSEADALGEQLKIMERCHKIASRIMRGDKVPPQDEQYLMMNDPDGYKLALAMRTPKKKPKEWESVLKDEEEKSSETNGEASAEEVSSCGESSGASDPGGAPDSGE